MLDQYVQADGYGWRVLATEIPAFFWSKLHADAFCKNELSGRILASVRRYISDVEKYDLFGKYMDTRRKNEAYNNLNEFIAISTVMDLSGMANYILDHEADLISLIPSKNHPSHDDACKQVNNLVWLCVRIRKQFKQTK